MVKKNDDAHSGDTNSSTAPDNVSPEPSGSREDELDSQAMTFDPTEDAHQESGEGYIAEDSIKGAFPPTGENAPSNSSGPQWTQEEDTMARKDPKKTGAIGTAFGGLKSFLLDDREQRAERKARKAAGLSGRDDAQANKPDSATGVAKPTKVSKRARLLGGKRGRAVALMATVVVVALLTVINTVLIFTRPSQSDIEEHVATAMREQGQDFPRGQAVAWAEQAVIDWATWDEDNQEEREVRMAQYLTSGMDSQAGWNGKGTQSVSFTSADPEPTVIDQNHALVNVDYRLEDESRRCVTVPVYSYSPEGLTGTNVQSAFGLSGNPIPRPCAPRTGAMEVSDETDEETTEGETLAANDELGRELASSFYPGFFSAWAASDANSLRQYTASGVTTIGLGGAMTSTPPPNIDNVVIRTPRDSQPVEGTIYEATVPVTWTVAGSSAQVTATYTVPMKKMGDRWYVAGEPEPASVSEAAGSGSPAEQISPEEGTEADDQSAEEQAADEGDDE